jgi:hypothetical protein
MLDNEELWKESPELIEIFGLLDSLGVSEYVRFAPYIMRGLDYYTGSTLWRSVSTNGHNNSTIGGTGANRADLFNATRAGGNNTMARQNLMGVTRPQLSDGWGTEMMNANAGINNSERGPAWATGYYGAAAGSYNTTPGNLTGYNDWYSTNTTQVNYHKFTCSKCHSPHASGLPALLVTNCLDIPLSNWSVKTGTTGVNPGANYAQNCHRNTDTANGQNDGWNRLKADQNE